MANFRKSILLILLTALILSGCGSQPGADTTPLPEPEETVAIAVATTAATEPEVTEETLPELPELSFIDIGGIRYPDAFGQPVLGQEEVAKLAKAGNVTAAAKAITHVGDAMYYMLGVPEFGQPTQACELFLQLLEGDYPSLNLMSYYWDDNAFSMVYVEHEGVYYGFDPFRPGNNWITEAENDIARDRDLDTLSVKVLENMPSQGTTLEKIKVTKDYTQLMRETYPAFGEPVLGKDQVAKLYATRPEEEAAEQITHIIDAYYYLEQKGLWFSPRDCCKLFVALIDGDYEASGTIELRFDDNQYFLAYVKLEDMYYAFDPHTLFSRDVTRPEAYWVFDSVNDCSQNADLNTLGQKVLDAYPYFGTNLMYVDITMDLEMLLKYHAPELGEPVLGREAARELYHSSDFEAAAKTITNADDAAFYMTEAMAFMDPPNSRSVYEHFARLLDGDYEAIGMIEVRYVDNSLQLGYVLQEGLYHIFDLTGQDQWVYTPRYGCDSGEDLDALVEKLIQANPHAGRKHVITQVFGNISKPHGVPVFDYAGFTFPAGLGQPQLSKAQIAALASETDYEKVARTITTLADAVAYYNAVPITHDTSRNPRARDTFPYFASAWQVMEQKSAFSYTACNLLHYLLMDDYEDVGYVYVRTGKLSHYLMYIYQDGLYYLVNPEEYSNPVQEELWLMGWPGLIGCAEDFQTIADSIVTDMKFDGDNYVTPDSVYLIRSPGDLLVNPAANPVFPEGTEVTRYYGADFSYAKTVHDWQSQTRLD